MSEPKWIYLWTNASDLGPKIWGVPIHTVKWNRTGNVAHVVDAVDRDVRVYEVYEFEIEGHQFLAATGERSPGIYPVYIPEHELDFYDVTDERQVKHH